MIKKHYVNLTETTGDCNQCGLRRCETILSGGDRLVNTIWYQFSFEIFGISLNVFK